MKTMRMKIIFPVLMTIGILSCVNDAQEGVTIEGKLDNPVSGQYIQLQKLTDIGLETIDSSLATNDGSFELMVEVSGPDFYRLNFYDRQFLNLILTGEEEHVIVLAHGVDPNGSSNISGSRDTDLLRSMDSLAQKRNSDFQLLNQEAVQARSKGDLVTFQDVQDQYYYLNEKHNQNMKKLIWNSIPSLAALYGINYIDLEQDFQFADSIVNEFSSSLADHALTMDLKKRVDGMRQLAIGSDAPEISLPDPDGNLVSLSSFRGNYVLIDFWAAWCRPCRMENPNVVRLYNEYKDENFEIFGVSLDRKREAWLQAIQADGLIWKHASDLKYFNSEAARTYQINAIPATYLIDPEGKIMAKGLRGESLRVKLEEIFG